MEPAGDLNLLGAVARRWVLVAVLTVVAATLGFGVSSAMSPVYRATASLLVGDFQNGEVSNNEIQAMQSLTKTYADIARREPVLASAAASVGLGNDWGQLRESVRVRVPNESPQVIEISVEGGNREQVQQVAGVVADRLVEYVRETSSNNDFMSPQLVALEELISDGERRVDELAAEQTAAGAAAPPELEAEIERIVAQLTEWRSTYASFKELTSSSSLVNIRILDNADAGRDPVRPNVRLNTVIAGGAGFLLALAVVYLLEARQARRPVRRGEHAADPPGSAQFTASLATIPNRVRNVRHAKASRRDDDTTRERSDEPAGEGVTGGSPGSRRSERVRPTRSTGLGGGPVRDAVRTERRLLPLEEQRGDRQVSER